MIFERPKKQDFDFRNAIQIDLQNQGFKPKEIQKIAERRAPPPGSRGDAGWWKEVWRPNREAPPLRELESEFGYQSAPVLTDLVNVAKIQGTALDDAIKGRPGNNYFIMRCGVWIAPNDGEKFEALKFEVRYKDATTVSMLPSSKMKTQLKVGGKADIGVDGKLEFGLPEISAVAATASASAKAQLESKFVVSFDYELKAPVVDAFGVGNPFCRWVMHEGGDLRNDVLFYPIVTTPKSVTALDCEFRAHFLIGRSGWKNSEFYLKPPVRIRVAT